MPQAANTAGTAGTAHQRAAGAGWQQGLSIAGIPALAAPSIAGSPALVAPSKAGNPVLNAAAAGAAAGSVAPAGSSRQCRKHPVWCLTCCKGMVLPATAVAAVVVVQQALQPAMSPQPGVAEAGAQLVTPPSPATGTSWTSGTRHHILNAGGVTMLTVLTLGVTAGVAGLVTAAT